VTAYAAGSQRGASNGYMRVAEYVLVLVLCVWQGRQFVCQVAAMAGQHALRHSVQGQAKQGTRKVQPLMLVACVEPLHQLPASGAGRFGNQCMQELFAGGLPWWFCAVAHGTEPEATRRWQSNWLRPGSECSE
jgi:hypothetical protein